MKRALALGFLVAASLAMAPTGSAAPPFASCGPNGLECATLSVPLDYTGATQGQLPLYVEVLPAAGTPKGVMFLIAGGPGQASAETFDLTTRTAYWRSYFPGYTLVAYDDRGTGKSGALSCPGARTIPQCANAIPGRAFYATRDHAEDIEAVRLALGVDKVALWGVSYGTKLAVAYALAHPSHVERLLLDSEVLPERDSLGVDSIRAIPGSIDGICQVNACPGITSGIGNRFGQLANSFQTSPLSATLRFAPSLGPFPLTIDGFEMVSLAFESDLSGAISSELPAAVDAAIAGRPQALQRLLFLDAVSNASSGGGGDVNIALLLATNCGDGPFPWQPNDTETARAAALAAAIGAVPPSSIAPFGTWALQTGGAFACIDWPSPSGGAALGPGPLPDVPVLVLAGSRDIRTPAAGGAAIASRFPQGRVVLVPGAGHSVLNHSDCAADAVRTWLNGGQTPATCTPLKPIVPPLTALRSSVATTPPVARVPGLPGRTIAALQQTLHDAEDAWLLGRHQSITLLGLSSGTVTVTPNGAIRLQAFSDVRGLAVTGSLNLKMDPYGSPVTPLTATSGTLTLTGRGASHGTFKALGNRLTGTLAGKRVTTTF